MDDTAVLKIVVRDEETAPAAPPEAPSAPASQQPAPPRVTQQSPAASPVREPRPLPPPAAVQPAPPAPASTPAPERQPARAAFLGREREDRLERPEPVPERRPATEQPAPSTTLPAAAPPPAPSSGAGISPDEYGQLVKMFGQVQADLVASSQGGVSKAAAAAPPQSQQSPPAKMSGQPAAPQASNAGPWALEATLRQTNVILAGHGAAQPAQVQPTTPGQSPPAPPASATPPPVPTNPPPVSPMMAKMSAGQSVSSKMIAGMSQPPPPPVHPMAAQMSAGQSPSAQASAQMIAGMSAAGAAAKQLAEAEALAARAAAQRAAFDPMAMAQDRREAEVRGEQVKLAYESMYGAAKQGKSAFDIGLDTAQRLRGTIGGVFGTMAGAALDVVAAVRQATQGAPPKSSARVEAEQRNAAMAKAPAAAQQAPPSGILQKAPSGGASAPPAGAAAAAMPAPSTAAATAPAAPAGAGAAAEVGVGTEAAAAAEGIGALAAAAAPAAIIIAAVAVGMKALDSALMDAASRYAQYSPEIATAQAMAEVRQTFGDMRRAQEAGPELAKYIEARSNLEQTWEDAKISFLQKMAPVGTALLEFINFVMPIFEVLGDIATAPIRLLTAILNLLKIWKEETETNPAQGFDFAFNPQSVQMPGL